MTMVTRLRDATRAAARSAYRALVRILCYPRPLDARDRVPRLVPVPVTQRQSELWLLCAVAAFFLLVIWMVLWVMAPWKT